MSGITANIIFFLMFVPGVGLDLNRELTLFQEKCISVDREAVVELAFGEVRGRFFQPTTGYSDMRFVGTTLLCILPKREKEI